MHRAFKPLLFTASLAPLAWLVYAVLYGEAGPNPAETILLTTGIWALRFLLASLAITPIRRITGWNVVIQYRRMLGLFAFFYGSIHMLGYLAFDRVFDLAAVAEDVVKRPFITAGMAALVLMVPLAVTSTKGWIRRLGRKWQTIHRLAYVSAIAACLHFIWKVKVTIGEPVYYAAILAVLLAVRLIWRFRSTTVPRRQTAQT